MDRGVINAIGRFPQETDNPSRRIIRFHIRRVIHPARIILDLPQVDLFFIPDLFITLERSERVISSDEVAKASTSDVSRARSSFPTAKSAGQGKLLERTFRKSRIIRLSVKTERCSC